MSASAVAASSTPVTSSLQQQTTVLENHSTPNKVSKAKVATFAVALIATIGLSIGAVLSGVGLFALPVALPLGIKAWTAFTAAAGLSSVLTAISGYFAFKKPKTETLNEEEISSPEANAEVTAEVTGEVTDTAEVTELPKKDGE
jgi:hypothetical protein